MQNKGIKRKHKGRNNEEIGKEKWLGITKRKGERKERGMEREHTKKKVMYLQRVGEDRRKGRTRGGVPCESARKFFSNTIFSRVIKELHLLKNIVFLKFHEID